MSTVAAIVLAAGASSRLGSPKQFARLGTETLLERSVRTAREAKLSPIYGVLSLDLSIGSLPQGMILVVNRHAAEGMASSIRAGLQALQADGLAATGTIILACDQPAVSAGHLEALATGGADILASAYSGRKGIPAYFPNAAIDSLLSLRGEAGARDLLQDAKAIPLPHGELDVDTIDDLEQARRLFILNCHTGFVRTCCDAHQYCPAFGDA